MIFHQRLTHWAKAAKVGSFGAADWEPVGSVVVGLQRVVVVVSFLLAGRLGAGVASAITAATFHAAPYQGSQ